MSFLPRRFRSQALFVLWNQLWDCNYQAFWNVDLRRLVRELYHSDRLQHQLWDSESQCVLHILGSVIFGPTSHSDGWMWSDVSVHTLVEFELWITIHRLDNVLSESSLWRLRCPWPHQHPNSQLCAINALCIVPQIVRAPNVTLFIMTCKDCAYRTSCQPIKVPGLWRTTPTFEAFLL